MCFKPCYKWNTFNTLQTQILVCNYLWVLNLVINGIPSIPPEHDVISFNDTDAVLNLVINGIPSILPSRNYRF